MPTPFSGSRMFQNCFSGCFWSALAEEPRRFALSECFLGWICVHVKDMTNKIRNKKAKMWRWQDINCCGKRVPAAEERRQSRQSVRQSVSQWVERQVAVAAAYPACQSMHHLIIITPRNCVTGHFLRLTHMSYFGSLPPCRKNSTTINYTGSRPYSPFVTPSWNTSQTQF